MSSVAPCWSAIDFTIASPRPLPGACDSPERVLDRFYRSGESQAPGSGLGLAIVKSIADQHGATLDIGRSESLGGLRVRLRFPSIV